jgi:thioredoxin 1
MTTIFKKNAKTMIVLFLVLIAVVTVWVVKNTLDDGPAQQTGNPDFALDVTGTLDLEQLKSYGLPIIIDFGADYCQPCRDLAPTIEALNEELQGKAIIRYVDVEKYPELAAGLPISVIPTQIYIDASGNPYEPEDPDTFSMKMYTSQDTGALTLTMHEGGLTKTQFTEILKEMGMK